MGMQEDKEGLVEPRASQRPVGGILPTPPPWGEEGDPLGSHLPVVTAQTANWRLLPIDVAPLA